MPETVPNRLHEFNYLTLSQPYKIGSNIFNPIENFEALKIFALNSKPGNRTPETILSPGKFWKIIKH